MLYLQRMVLLRSRRASTVIQSIILAQRRTLALPCNVPVKATVPGLVQLRHVSRFAVPLMLPQAILVCQVVLPEIRGLTLVLQPTAVPAKAALA